MGRKKKENPIITALGALGDAELEQIATLIIKMSKKEVDEPPVEEYNELDTEPRPIRRIKRVNAVERPIDARKSNLQARIEPIRRGKTLSTNYDFIPKNEMMTINKDKIIDKKLSGGNAITARGERQTTMEVECVDCGHVFDASIETLYKDPDGIIHATCDRCAKSKRK